MNLSRFIRGIGLVTILSLIYIHLQIQIYDLAYQGKDKEHEMIELSENNANTTYDILKLKSSQYLGGRLLHKDAKLCFLDHKKVIRLVTADAVEEGTPVPSNSQRSTNPLITFLAPKAEAWANTIQKHNIFKKLRRAP